MSFSIHAVAERTSIVFSSTVQLHYDRWYTISLAVKVKRTTLLASKYVDILVAVLLKLTL